MISAIYFKDKYPDLDQTGALEKWNSLHSKCINQNIFSIYEWGSYKESNWKVERILFFNKETFVGMAQILFKNLGPFRLGWCSSGINLTNYKYLSGIIDSLDALYDFNKTIIRFNFLDKGDGDTRFEFDSVESLKPVPTTINSGYTIRHYVSTPIKIPSNFSSNNRYYLKKAKEHDFKFVVTNVTPSEFVNVHKKMIEHKKLDELSITEDSISRLCKFYNEKIKMVKVMSGEDCLSAALIIFVDKNAYYYLAGSTEEGRDKSSSFFMIEQLLIYFEQLKIVEFDFGGITPFKENAKGVNRFKIGFGGQIINYIGERNLCKNIFLNWMFNFFVVRKLG